MSRLIRQPRWVMTGAALGALVFSVGIVVSFTVGQSLDAGQRHTANEVMDGRTKLMDRAINTEVSRYVDTMRSTSSALGALDVLTKTKYDEIAESISRMQLAGVTSMAYVVESDDAELPAVQQQWRDAGATGLVLKPVATTTEHRFTIFVHSLDGHTSANPGIDVTQAATPTAALDDAKRVGDVVVSDTYQLIVDQDLPSDKRQQSFVMTTPVYGSGSAGRSDFKGWVLLGLRGQDFIGVTLSNISQGMVDVSLKTRNRDGSVIAVAALDAAHGHMDLHREMSVPVAQSRWTLGLDASHTRLPGGSNSYPRAMMVLGLTLSTLLSGLVYLLATGRGRAEARVLTATLDLKNAEQHTRQQADLLAAVMNSISDGVGVVDENGEFLLHNPAAKALLGIDEDKGGAENWQDHYGIFEADGITPFPTERLPLVRALNGESTDGVEMIIRNAMRPDGVLIDVSGRPLKGEAQQGAVAIFHDITELRRHEKELSSFAGMVAHDLKSPLTVIHAYIELLEDDLSKNLAPTQQGSVRTMITNMRSGVMRMVTLIDGLLAYSSARDRLLEVSTVDLQELATDLVSSTMMTFDGSTSVTPTPNIEIDHLPLVSGDVVLIRQIMQNLIGNAVKYTREGERAQVKVSATLESEKWVRIDVADRGIGIPVTEQHAVFEGFHRARNGRAFSGTGLGLAICQRVVERHGGTIWVSDNPGGGSRFSFTLPLATTDISPATSPTSAPSSILPNPAPSTSYSVV